MISFGDWRLVIGYWIWAIGYGWRSNMFLLGFRILNNTNNYSFNNINNITKRLHFNTTIILFILDIDFNNTNNITRIVYIVGY